MPNKKYHQYLDLDTLLEELWENATFDDEIYELLDTVSQLQEKEQDLPDKIIKQIFYKLATLRNKNLITQAQQEKLRNTTVMFFGLSTGSHSATTWMMQSRAKQVKIVDPDTISPSNLNRLSFGWDQIGELKTDATKTRVHTINPHANVISTTKTDLNTTKKLFNNPPKPDVIVEAIDDLPQKVELRKIARKHRLPYIMATDIGDNVMLDVERYDTDPDLPLFHGRVPHIESIDFESITPHERIRLAMDIAGFEHNSEAMLKSLLSIGEDIITWPQLGATSTIAGGIVTTTIKKIVLEESVESKRYYFSLDDTLDNNFNQPSQQKNREELIKKIKEKFDSHE